MNERSLPAVYMRGGTSRAVIFHDRDLPPAGPARDAIFCAALGSPDPHGRQLNGMGGGITSLSKVAVVGPPSHPRADVDYTFGQVDVATASVGYRGNCGNISAAIGHFAVDEGLVHAASGPACVVIHNTNTGKLIEARFTVTNGQADTTGDFVLPGVAGTGAPIELAFLDPGGAATGKLFPTGRMCDTLDIPQIGAIEASIVDAANPTVFVRADQLRLTGAESPAALSADTAVMAALHHVRATAAVAAGLINHPAEARTSLRNLPLVCIVSGVGDAGPGPPRIRVRMLSADQPHRATPLTGALCLAVAAQIPGTLPATILQPGSQGCIIIEHASGTLPVNAIVLLESSGPTVLAAVVRRTARRLMDGRIYI